MAWTKEQQAAIDTRGQNILVSAGAGSGKTAVLTERIVNLVHEGHSLDKLLVITFTNLASLEMKERVRKKLKERIDTTNEEVYKEALNFIDSSNIMTFNSYTMNLARKYFDRLNISREFNVANGYYISVKIDNILDDILASLYENRDQRLVDYFKNFKDLGDDSLKANIKSVYYSICKKLDIDSYIDSYASNFFSDKNLDSIVSSYSSLVATESESIRAAIEDLYNSLDANLNEGYLNILEDKLLKLQSCTTYKSYKEFYDDIVGTTFPRKRSAKGAPADDVDYKKLFNKALDDFSKYVSFENEEAIYKNIKDTKPFVDLYLDIVKDLYHRLNKFKMDNNYFEFSDIDRMVINLVKNNADVREEIKSSLDEILIDEYQDNNDLQEEFIKCIANNNVFMVGDVKQSIYRFRNANPYIFKSKYNSYKALNGGIKIDLNKNFRSRSEVLDNINLIFNRIMTDSLGDAEYQAEHQMNYGLLDYDLKKTSFNYNMDIITYDPMDYNTDPNSVKAEFKKELIEFFIIANDIKKKLDSKMKIYAKVDGVFTLREIRPSDICILMDRGTNFALLKEILQYNKIPSAINADENLKDSRIIPVISALLNVVLLQAKNQFNNDYYKSLLSVGRSFLFKNELDDDYLVGLVYDLKHCKDIDSKKEILINNPIYKIASDIAPLVYTMSPTAIYEMIIDKFMVSSKLRYLTNISNELVVLEFIKDFISNIEGIGESLFEIKEYLNEIVSNDNTDGIKYSLSVDGIEGVKIMNIHKSKGLEFPICYFAGLSSKFNDADFKSKVGLISDKMFFDAFDTISPVKMVASNEFYREDRSEKVRLLYVALTRTREHMIIVMPEFKEDKAINKSLYKDYKCMQDFLFIANDLLEPYKREAPLLLNITKEYELTPTKPNYNSKRPIYNVNDYRGDLVLPSRISKEVIEVLSDEEQENLDYGTHLHAIMEGLDFKNIDLSLLNDEDYKIISNVLSNDLFKDIAKAKTYHEHEFIFESNNKQYHGIIDLLAEYDDHVEIIDYKLLNIDHKEYDRQLSIYRDYVASVIVDKPIKCYLLSLLKNESREVQ